MHALHNNAYAVHPEAAGDLLGTSLEAWDWTIRTCLTSQFLCCRAVLPHMLEHGNGSIINVSSGNGLGREHRVPRRTARPRRAPSC